MATCQRASTSGLIFSLLVFLSQAAWADDIDRLLDVSGFTMQMETVPDQIRQGMVEGLASVPLPGEAVEQISASVQSSVSVAGIMDGVNAQVGEALSDADVQMLLEWYTSDLGQRITAAEAAVSEPEAAARIQGLMGSLLDDKERLAIARQVNDVVDGTEFAMQLMESTQMAIISGLMDASGPSAEAEGEAVKQQTREAFATYRPEIERFMLVALVYAYRDFSIAELSRYRDFLQQPAARAFNGAVLQGTLDQWETVFGTLGRSIGEIIATYAAS